MQPQALPKALSKQLNKQTETVGTATSPQLNVQALTALQPHQATDVSSSSTVMSSNESAGIAPSKPAIVKTTAAAPCRSAAPVQTAAYQAETSSASASKAAADTPRASLTVAHSTTESNTALQQQAQPMGPSSRPSTSCSSRSSRSSSGKRTKAGCSSFDTRLALLHKGLPTSFTPTMTSRPVSRSSRPSAATQHVNAASADSQALSGTNNEAVAVLTAADSSNKVSIQASDRQELEKATDAAAKTAGTEGEALSPAQMAAQLQSELNAAKPQSPTSVLPTADLLNTTYHNFYGLAEAYPELYQQAAAAGQSDHVSCWQLLCARSKGLVQCTPLIEGQHMHHAYQSQHAER